MRKNVQMNVKVADLWNIASCRGSTHPQPFVSIFSLQVCLELWEYISLSNHAGLVWGLGREEGPSLGNKAVRDIFAF